MRVTLCAATYNRPQGLERLLTAVAALDPLDGEGTTLHVVIVDNSPEANARTTVEDFGKSYRWPLHYESEPRRGITYARNAALCKAEALGTDLVVFIDDDEYPAASWLNRLLARQRSSVAAAVQGAVLSVFPAGTPDWIIDGGFFDTQNAPDGAELDDAHTGNVLIDMAKVRRLGLSFDHRYALSGGEDTIFFRQLLEAGERIVYAADAVVFETVPESRARLGWLMRRWYRTGNIDAALFLRGRRSASWRPLGNLCRGTLRIAAGSALFAANLAVLGLGRRERIVRPLFTLCRGCGILASTLGWNYLEYRKVHGA
ncbi:glycosyltransferase family 2 protein [Pelagibius sp.]|uniref:glycosyltransferase n=1 Tax=Pelagibius sp. TaxID=1931238 RepID=UPI002637D8F9|nr:glycosyltransferase family 2 protein [Pelagibius sp.]